MRPEGRKERSIDLKIFLVEYPVCVISVHINFSLFCDLNI